MAERFRFRLPWLTAPRPADEEQQPRPPVQTQPPVRPATTIPIQRPPFRPAGISQEQAPLRTESQPAVPPRAATQDASVPPSPSSAGRESSEIAPVESPPPEAQAQPRAESQAAMPPRATTESQAPTQTKSPPHATVRTQATTVPPSPSRVGPQSRSTSQLASPSRAAPQSRAAPAPPSPSRTTPQARPARQTPPQPQSSPRSATQRVAQTTAEPSSPSKMGNQAQPTVSQPSSPKKQQLTTQETSQPTLQPSPQTDTRLAVSLQVPEPPQLKTEIAPVIEPVSKSQDQTEPLQPPTVQTASASTFRQTPKTAAAYEKPDFNTTNADHPAQLSQPLKKLMETEEGEKVAELLKNAEKNGSATEGKDLPDATLDIEGMPQREAAFRRKKKTVIRSSREQEQVKFTNTRNTTTQSHKPVTSTGGKNHLHREIREDVSRFVRKMEAGYPMQPIGETPVSIVTLAGENKGAIMHSGTESARKEEPVHIHRGYKINPDDSTDATSDGEGISKGRKSEDELTKEEPTTTAYINSNLQSINNSIVFDSSVNERNPGVHLTISQKPTEPANSAQPGQLHTRKAEFNIIPAEKHAYEPTVRRRCLRGLLLESSDSDPGNPEKPRRHGCRYSCGEKGKDKDIGVF